MIGHSGAPFQKKKKPLIFQQVAFEIPQREESVLLQLMFFAKIGQKSI